ncbi:MAG TPA: IS21 family transposase [Planctomycetota bacterium]|nr:IS21 family transposase [Planctomycetota bacterium]
MARGRKDVLDIREIIRLLRAGRAVREIARDLDVHRKTIKLYRKLAQGEGWLGPGDLPTLAQIQATLSARLPDPKPGPSSRVEGFRDKVLRLHGQGVEAKAIFQILRDEDQFPGSYSGILRFLRKEAPPAPKAFVRIEVPPGEEAQVDFGYAGMFLDPATGQMRRGWAFVVVLSHSRHLYAEIVFDQTVETWIACHVRAWEFFGGVPRRVVVDNLKAAITRASFQDPEVQRAYREAAEHYGFAIAPCRVATPEHKGKVESSVHYVKRNALSGRVFRDVHEANEYLLHWAVHVAGIRDHGTTHVAPYVAFQAAEKAALSPLPETRFEMAVFKQVKLHPDCHVVFDRAFYSAPYRLIGQTLWLRATRDRVELYYQHERVATHPRAKEPGKRVSNIVHYPPEKVTGLMVTPVRLREEAAGIGEATAQLVTEMLADRPLDRLRGAQGVLGLAKRYGAARLEAACRRALVFGTASYRTVESILRQGLDRTPLPPDMSETGPVPKRAAFARPVFDLAAQLRRKSWS